MPEFAPIGSRPSLSLAKLTIEPRLRHTPFPLHGARRNLQRLGGLLQAQPAKETHLNNLALALVEGRQFVQRVVQSDQVSALSVRDPLGVGERNMDGVSAIFLRLPPPRFINKDAAHQL